jgi:hypothetical protein
MKPSAALALIVLLGACSPNASPAPITGPPAQVVAATTTLATVVAADPYDTFTALAKADNLEVPVDLGRDFALTRALLGCGTTWPPHTLDAALATAYAVQIGEAKKLGHC